jgi:protein-S-isoprenylcysteine O-methyltransferase Ste14
LLVAICVMLTLHFLLPMRSVLAFPWTLVGVVPAAAGVALNLFADQALKRAETTVKPFGEPASLVTVGAFGVSRNPMYLGMVLILLGLALFLGTLTPFAVCVAFPFLLRYRFIRVEEKTLAEKFGARLQTYKARVRRWL